jgi:hypothetical protein
VKTFALFTLLLPMVVGCAGSENPGPSEQADTIDDAEAPDGRQSSTFRANIAAAAGFRRQPRLPLSWGLLRTK